MIWWSCHLRIYSWFSWCLKYIAHGPQAWKKPGFTVGFCRCLSPPPPPPLEWRHNGRDVVSNHQPHHYLLNRLFRRRSKKTSKLRITGLCAVNSPHKWPVTRKMCPLMTSSYQLCISHITPTMIKSYNSINMTQHDVMSPYRGIICPDRDTPWHKHPCNIPPYILTRHGLHMCNSWGNKLLLSSLSLLLLLS